jgi:hypothetical protein
MVIGAAGVFVLLAAALVRAQGIARYDATSGLLPEDVCPPWTLFEDASPEDPQLVGDVLVLSTSEDGENMNYRQLDADIAAPADPFVLEARMRFVSGGATQQISGAHMAFTLEGKQGFLVIDDGEIYLFASPFVKGPSASVPTTDDFHTYRMEANLSTGGLTVLRDGVPTLEGAMYPDASADLVAWGDTTRYAHATSEWQFLSHNASTMADACSTTTTSSSLVTTTTSSSLATTTTTSTTFPPAAQLLSGKKLLLKWRVDRTKKRLVKVLSKDREFTLGKGPASADDPVEAGGSLRIVSFAGDAFDHTYELPKTNWRYLKAKKPADGYKFSKGDPIKMVLVKPGKMIKIVGKGATLGHTLTMDPQPVHVELRLGDGAYCMTFGGTVRFTENKKYLAKKAPRAIVCPTQGSVSPETLPDRHRESTR